MEHPDDLDVLSVTTTLGTLEDAQRLARELIARRLVACVQVEPGLQSFYRWEGRVCEDAEVRLSCKTVPAAAAALQAFLAEQHPYALPQFLAATWRGSPGYAAWVRAEVSLPAPPP